MASRSAADEDGKGSGRRATALPIEVPRTPRKRRTDAAKILSRKRRADAKEINTREALHALAMEGDPSADEDLSP